MYIGMTTGHRFEPKTFRMRKQPKKTASNARITREPFGELPQRILSIPTFIDDYNHYMRGIDQSNQLRAAFTTYFPRNQKEFFPGAFWAIDIAVYNSYKLHLALNGSKKSSKGKRDPQQHRKWIEDLVDLLFQVNNDDFGADFTSKPYPKYQYQTPSKGQKTAGKKAFLQAINRSEITHLYVSNPFKKRGYCFFCLKKDNLEPQKKKKSKDSLVQKTFQLNQEDLIEISKEKKSKQWRFQGKRIK
jgi:hypothetical protein